MHTAKANGEIFVIENGISIDKCDPCCKNNMYNLLTYGRAIKE